MMRTANLKSLREIAYPNTRVWIAAGKAFSLRLENSKFEITMYVLYWVVDIDSILDNVEEEAKWLIDFAVSFLRRLRSVAGKQSSIGKCGAASDKRNQVKRYQI